MNELILTLGRAIIEDTDADYGQLCWQLQRGYPVIGPAADRLYAHEWWAARIRDVDSEALARWSLERE